MFWSIKEKAQNLGNIAKSIAKEMVQEEQLEEATTHYLDADRLAQEVVAHLQAPLQHCLTQQIAGHFQLLAEKESQDLGVSPETLLLPNCLDFSLSLPKELCLELVPLLSSENQHLHSLFSQETRALQSQLLQAKEQRNQLQSLNDQQVTKAKGTATALKGRDALIQSAKKELIGLFEIVYTKINTPSNENIKECEDIYDKIADALAFQQDPLDYDFQGMDASFERLLRFYRELVEKEQSTRLAQLETQLACLQKTSTANKQLDTQLQESQSQSESLMTQQKHLIDELKVQCQESQNKSNLIRELAQDKQTLQKEVKTLKKEKETQQQVEKSLQEKNAQHQGAQRVVESLESEITMQQAQIQTLMQQAEEIGQQHSLHSQELCNQIAGLKLENSQILNYKRQLNNCDQSMQALEREIEGLSGEKRDLDTQLQTCSRDRLADRTSIGRLETERDQLKDSQSRMIDMAFIGQMVYNFLDKGSDFEVKQQIVQTFAQVFGWDEQQKQKVGIFKRETEKTVQQPVKQVQESNKSLKDQFMSFLEDDDE